MMEATFTSENKLATVSLVFDVMGFMQQLRRAAGKTIFQTIPSCLQMAEEPSDDLRVILTPQPPYQVVRLNMGWTTGSFAGDFKELVGKNMVLEKTPGRKEVQNNTLVASIFESMARQLPCSILVVFCPSPGRRVVGLLALFPLVQNNQITHYLGLLEPYRDPSALMMVGDVPAVLSFR